MKIIRLTLGALVILTSVLFHAGRSSTAGTTAEVPLAAVASRLLHNNVGYLDINWVPTDPPGVETRRKSVAGSDPPSLAYTIVFKFVNNLVSVGSTGAETPTISCGTLDLANTGINGSDAHEYILNFTVLDTLDLSTSPPTYEQCDGQFITATLSNVNDSVGNHSDTVSATMGLLIGDVNASRRTDSGDVAFTRSKTVSIPNQFTCPFDVDTSGRIDAGDVTRVRQHTITVLP
jgi:hypothetical protein